MEKKAMTYCVGITGLRNSRLQAFGAEVDIHEREATIISVRYRLEYYYGVSSLWISETFI